MPVCCCSLSGTRACENCQNAPTRTKIDDFIDYSHYKPNAPQIIKTIDLTEFFKEVEEERRNEYTRKNSYKIIN